jgi:ubiquinone biosynthesis monooxygenase Coq7
MLGEKAAYACNAAVEEVIDEHYAAQITALEDGRDPALKAAVEDFRADEAAHRETALENGAEQAPGYKLLSETIKAGCRIAIKLSERI